MILIIIIILIIILLLPSKTTEHLTNTDLSSIDIGAIKALSDIANKLMKDNGVILPGNLNIVKNSNIKIGDTILEESDIIKLREYTRNNNITGVLKTTDGGNSWINSNGVFVNNATYSCTCITFLNNIGRQT